MHGHRISEELGQLFQRFALGLRVEEVYDYNRHGREADEDDVVAIADCVYSGGAGGDIGLDNR
jgi:hypothetical protein